MWTTCIYIIQFCCIQMYCYSCHGHSVVIHAHSSSFLMHGFIHFSIFAKTCWEHVCSMHLENAAVLTCHSRNLDFAAWSIYEYILLPIFLVDLIIHQAIIIAIIMLWMYASCLHCCLPMMLCVRLGAAWASLLHTRGFPLLRVGLPIDAWLTPLCCQEAWSAYQMR